jgi:homogentisate phytyltransferase/homogentisate geranylgeranyltransferase
MKSLVLLWRFSRPHTLIGSAVSISCLFILATDQILEWPGKFWLALISALTCNIFITGYNQLVDIDLDRINKPDLPLAAGSLSLKQGKLIIYSALIISLIAAAIASKGLLALIMTISIIGFLYSWKSTYLKKSHPLAAFAITAVRGILVNLGFYSFFTGFGPIQEIPIDIWLLTGFVVLFSLGISWFKDIPDVDGDIRADVGSLAIKMGISRTFNLGVVSVCLGYILCSFVPLFAPLEIANGGVVALGFGLSGLFFLSFAQRTKPAQKKSMQRFYKVFWVLFALAYVVFALAAVL